MPTRRSVVVAMLALAACGDPMQRGAQAQILLFDGSGASPGSVAALERLLRRNKLDFARVDSRDLNDMGLDRLRTYRLLIVPGGNFELMGKGLTPIATSNIRTAVQGGLNYLGICAGAFIAGASPYNGINLTDGIRFNFFSASARGIRKAAIPITRAEAPPLEYYWEDGPELSGWGEGVALYPDGKPAIVQGRLGKGWIVLTGIHPEAEESWRLGMFFTSTVQETGAFAAALLHAAYRGRRLPRAPAIS